MDLWTCLHHNSIWFDTSAHSDERGDAKGQTFPKISLQCFLFHQEKMETGLSSFDV